MVFIEARVPGARVTKVHDLRDDVCHAKASPTLEDPNA
jgi:hypothetical protein